MRICLSLFLLLPLLHSSVTEASTIAPTKGLTHYSSSPLGAGVGAANKTHMLVLKCPINEKQITMSRVAVLNVKDGARDDIALVTGHGIANEDGVFEKGCFVQDFEGKSRKVKSVRLAPNYVSGTSSDWGLIKFSRIRTKNLVRYPMEVAEVLVNQDGHHLLPTRFSTARGMPENGQDCAIIPRKYSGLKGTGFSGVLAHNCLAMSGQSGSPFSSKTDDLLGIHIGSTWSLASQFTGEPGHQGFLRLFDSTMVEEISTLIQDMKDADKR